MKGGLRFIILMVAGALVMPGCEKSPPPSGTVTGKVTCNGVPVTRGMIRFHPTEGGVPYPGTLNSDGSFSFSGVPLGDMVVTVQPVTDKWQPAGDDVPIPDKYKDPATSDFYCKIRSGPQKLEIDLRSD
jgi:hypothetical protein